MQYCIRGGGICINKLMHELGLVLGAGFCVTQRRGYCDTEDFGISPTSDPVMMLRHSEGEGWPRWRLFF